MLDSPIIVKENNWEFIVLVCETNDYCLWVKNKQLYLLRFVYFLYLELVDNIKVWVSNHYISIIEWKVDSWLLWVHFYVSYSYLGSAVRSYFNCLQQVSINSVILIHKVVKDGVICVEPRLRAVYHYLLMIKSKYYLTICFFTFKHLI